SESPPKPGESIGCGKSLLLMIIAYIVLSAIGRVLNGSRDRFDQVICLGTLVCFAVLWSMDNKSIHKARLDRDAQTREWARACKEAQVAIVSRRYLPGGTSENDYGEVHSYRPYYHLDLEMNADQR